MLDFILGIAYKPVYGQRTENPAEDIRKIPEIIVVRTIENRQLIEADISCKELSQHHEFETEEVECDYRQSVLTDINQHIPCLV